MKQYGELVALLEWAEKQRAVRTETKVRRTNKDKSVDVFQLLQKKRQEANLLEAFIKDMEKINKKEDKKEPKWHDKITTPQLAMIMLVLVPVYVTFLQKIVH